MDDSVTTLSFCAVREARNGFTKLMAIWQIVEAVEEVRMTASLNVSG